MKRPEIEMNPYEHEITNFGEFEEYFNFLESKLSQLKSILTYSNGKPRDLLTINDVEKMLEIIGE